MMGLQAASISGGAMIFSLLGGQFSKLGWSRAYLAFLLLIPCMIIVAKCMPKGLLENEASVSSLSLIHI